MDKDLWKFKTAKTPTSLQQVMMLVCVIIGCYGVVTLFDWWFSEFHIVNRTLFTVLSLFFWYEMLRNIFMWLNYLKIDKPAEVPVPAKNMSVAVFTTSTPGEPLSMFEKTLQALEQMTYPHTTYLLDDTNDPAFRVLAEKYGAVCLEMIGLPGAKAGKVNQALKETTEDFILILDPDHIVFPNFLDQTLGFFQDPEVGFVQVSQGYYNQYRSVIATGAAEQTYLFYGPTLMGMYSFNASVAIGANCTFRRTALDSIGGHARGLAEDLQTALAIHSKGWKSVYNPVIVSRGLVPEDFGSYCKQQLKWARGLFEILFDDLPKAFKGLTFFQKLFYSSTSTYYLFGFSTFIFTLIPLLYFVTDVMPANMVFTDFFIKYLPIMMANIGVYFLNQQFLCDTKSEKGIYWKGMILKFATWPVVTYAFVLSLFNKKIPYIPTEKTAQNKFLTPFVIPLIVYVVVFVLGLVGLFSYRWYFLPASESLLSLDKTWGMLGFSIAALVQSIWGIVMAYEAVGLKAEDPWSKVVVESVKQDEKEPEEVVV